MSNEELKHALQQIVAENNATNAANTAEEQLKAYAEPYNFEAPVIEQPVLQRKSEAGYTQEQVNHPEHYSRWPMEPIEFIAVNDLPWWLANIVKYCMRFDAKDGLADMYKARSYLEMKIAHLEGKPRFWEAHVARERSLNAAPAQ